MSLTIKHLQKICRIAPHPFPIRVALRHPVRHSSPWLRRRKPPKRRRNLSGEVGGFRPPAVSVPCSSSWFVGTPASSRLRYVETSATFRPFQTIGITLQFFVQ